MSDKEIILTKEGLENLNKEYRNLLDVERPAVIEQLQAARSMGDLSENADYDAARNKQAEIESRIKEIEEILANAKVIENKKSAKTVNVGATVKFLDLTTNEEKTVKIVSSIEADPINSNKISNTCPLGVALIGRTVGTTTKVKAINSTDIKILEILYN